MSTSSQLEKSHVMEALITIRKEWEEATDGEPLVAVNGSIGLILLDVVQGIGLSEVECSMFLGQFVID